MYNNVLPIYSVCPLKLNVYRLLYCHQNVIIIGIEVLLGGGSAVLLLIACFPSLFQERVWSSTDQPDGGVPMDNKPTTGETVVPDDPAPPKNE